MKERPILFSAPMVKAILAGTKTQTRRLLNPQPTSMDPVGTEPGWHWKCPRLGAGYCHTNESAFIRLAASCPAYGAVGDRLWVRERMRVIATYNDGNQVRLRYEADGFETGLLQYPDRLARPTIGKCLAYGGPREGSRIDLEVAAPEHVERLHDITEDDARAEGVTGDASLRPAGWDADGDDWNAGTTANYVASCGDPATPIGHFRHLWESINGTRAPWASNPWVRVVSFKRVRP